MHLRKSVFALLLFAGLALCALAADSWKTRHYEKWSARDVEKILNDSPWARPILIPYSPYLNGDSRETDTHIKIGSAKDPAEDPIPTAQTETLRQHGKFVLRWNTSLTIRRALYRDAVLHGLPPDYARHYIDDPHENLELVLIAVGQTFLPPVEESTLLKNTYITLQPSGQKIYPTHVRIRDLVDARNEEGFTFEFPVKLSTNTASLFKDTTEVQFFTQVGVRVFNAKFRPEEMVGSEGADLF